MPTPFDAAAKFDVVTHIGRGLVFRGQPRSCSKGGGTPALPNFGTGLVFRRSATPSIPRGVWPRHSSIFGFSPACAYAVWPRTTNFDVWEKRVLGGHPRHCILHKCVARFVSDSGVSFSSDLHNHVSEASHIESISWISPLIFTCLQHI